MVRTRNKSVKAAPVAGARLKLKWVVSIAQTPKKQRAVIKGLGFTRLNQEIDREDTPSIRGMVAKVPHLVKIVE